jgi:hypothetical protein
MTDKVTIIESQDKEGNPVQVALKSPGVTEYRDSQVEYNKAFRKALDSGALLRQKLTDYMREQGIWNEEKQKENDRFVDEIRSKEEALRRGGIKLTEAKQIALDLRLLRLQFREFIAEKNQMDQNSAEGQADNARFSELVRLCMLNPNTRQPFFPSQSDYDNSADQPWVVEASSQLASMIYDIDPDYDNKLQENKFLKDYSFVNDDLRLINENGHLIDIDGRLINEEGRFVAYRNAKAEAAQDLDKQYFVNREGKEIIPTEGDDGSEIWVEKGAEEAQPFLDDSGKPIELPSQKVQEANDISSDSISEQKTTKRRRKTTTKSEKEVKED